MKGIVTLLSVAALMAFTLLTAAAAIAQQETVTVEVRPTAQLIQGGQTLLVTVEVACEPGLQVLEAHVDVTQDSTFAQASIGSVVCDAKPHVHKVRVNPLDGQQFSREEARVSAFVLLLDPATGTTVQGQDTLIVRVVGPG
jgi:hypothetical protein